MSNEKFNIDSQLKLNDNNLMPRFGLGVYRSSEGAECYNAVKWALDHGYRLIDTASFYQNEASVGKAIRDSQIPRQDIFVTSKVWNSDHGYDETLRAFDKSMEELDLDYMDLYLIHFPVQHKRLDTWKAMERILESGACRSIGVSNYMTQHITELLSNCNITPAVNQIELSPFCYKSRLDIIELCQDNNIAIQAYSPLVRTQKMNHSALVDIAKKYQKKPAQILIRWAIEHGFIVIPKSSNQGRIQENADIFDFAISSNDLQRIDDFDENFIVCWDPTDAP